MADLNKNIPLLIIGGATASGKTALSIEISKHLDIEIISADSRQVYKHLDIGTAKPTLEEQSAVKHHFIDILELDEYFSAGVFGNLAYSKAREIYQNGKIPVIVGGSGLYIKSLTEGFFEDDNYNQDSRDLIRQNLEQKLISLGKDVIYEQLNQIDPLSAERYPDKNPRRIFRALEYYQLTGKKFSETFNTNQNRSVEFAYFMIDYPRESLYDRINRRSELMWENGLIEETKNVLKMGYSKSLNSLNTVGYKEAIEFIEGKISENRAIELIQQNTRRYAKRQITWFKKIEDLILLDGKLEAAKIAKIAVDIFTKQILT